MQEDIQGIRLMIQRALQEDVGVGDHSSMACIPHDALSKAHLLVKEDGVIAGLEIAAIVFSEVDPELQLHFLRKDGDELCKGDVAFIVSGRARSILTAERLALNLMQRMSGIATRTRYVTKMLEGTAAKVLDTRKTTPGLRYFEKLAVRIGGGMNHRFGLFDMIMLKDNHIDYAGGIAKAMDRVRNYLKENQLDLPVEVETRNMDEVEEVLRESGVHRVMLDNFTPEQVKEAVDLIDGRLETEASGGITPENVRPYAEAGVDYVSMGALTHSVRNLDLSLKAID